MSMTAAIAIRYYIATESPTVSCISGDAYTNYAIATLYDSNYLPRVLYESRHVKLSTVLKYINHIQQLRDKRLMCGQTPSSWDIIIQMLEALPEMLQWTSWIMVTKASLPDQNSQPGYKMLHLLLHAYEVDPHRKKSLLPDPAL